MVSYRVVWSVLDSSFVDGFRWQLRKRVVMVIVVPAIHIDQHGRVAFDDLVEAGVEAGRVAQQARAAVAVVQVGRAVHVVAVVDLSHGIATCHEADASRNVQVVVDVRHA